MSRRPGRVRASTSSGTTGLGSPATAGGSWPAPPRCRPMSLILDIRAFERA